MRLKRGVSQAELADAVGVSLRTIERLEAGRIRDPGIRLINNCALALGVKLEQLIHPVWRQWLDCDGAHPQPPDRNAFLNQKRLSLPLEMERRLLGEE
jgi:transcriptional regulator with XRE-family HTH domain